MLSWQHSEHRARARLPSAQMANPRGDRSASFTSTSAFGRTAQPVMGNVEHPTAGRCSTMPINQNIAPATDAFADALVAAFGTPRTLAIIERTGGGPTWRSPSSSSTSICGTRSRQPASGDSNPPRTTLRTEALLMPSRRDWERPARAMPSATMADGPHCGALAPPNPNGHTLRLPRNDGGRTGEVSVVLLAERFRNQEPPTCKRRLESAPLMPSRRDRERPARAIAERRDGGRARQVSVVHLDERFRGGNAERPMGNVEHPTAGCPGPTRLLVLLWQHSEDGRTLPIAERNDGGRTREASVVLLDERFRSRTPGLGTL